MSKKIDLYFDDKNGELREVAKNISIEEDTNYIKDYIHQLNPTYHIPYIRTLTLSTQIIYDVGSHSEYFRGYYIEED